MGMLANIGQDMAFARHVGTTILRASRVARVLVRLRPAEAA